QIPPVIQRASEQNGAALASNAALAEVCRLQSGNSQALVPPDIAELAGERRLAERAVQGMGQVIALALEVIGRLAQFQTKNAAPTTARVVRRLHRIAL